MIRGSEKLTGLSLAGSNRKFQKASYSDKGSVIIDETNERIGKTGRLYNYIQQPFLSKKQNQMK